MHRYKCGLEDIGNAMTNEEQGGMLRSARFGPAKRDDNRARSAGKSWRYVIEDASTIAPSLCGHLIPRVSRRGQRTGRVPGMVADKAGHIRFAREADHCSCWAAENYTEGSLGLVDTSCGTWDVKNGLSMEEYRQISIADYCLV